VAKRYVEEKGSDLLDRIYSRAEAGDIQIAFSIWNVGEVLGVLDRYRTRKIISEAEFRASYRNLILESVKMLKLGSLIIQPITSAILVESWVIVLNHHVYQADALQIENAKTLGSDLLLTADIKLLEVARSSELAAFDIESEADDVDKALE
jgi:predicted nucleic acid-binding protein